MRYIILLSLFLLLETGSAQNTGQGIDLSSRPPSGRTTPGREVTFTCTLDLSIVSDNPVVWARTIGSIRMNIALGTIKQDEFVPMGRYKLSTWPEAGNKKTYTLTIASVQYEDSGVMECSILHSSRKQTKTLAVCAVTDSSSCSCVESTGWPSPDCFGESKSQQDLDDEYRKTVTGLGVCFAIAVIYGITITVLFARDCIKIIHKKKQRKQAQIKNQQRPGYNPYADSEKLTVEDDAASIPESGVWSQSDGKNGSDRSNGSGQRGQIGSDRSNGLGQRGGQIVTDRALSQQQGDSNVIRERPVLHNRPGDHQNRSNAPERPSVLAVQAHVNPAYSPDETSSSSLAGHGAVKTFTTDSSGDVRPKTRPEPSKHSPHPTSANQPSAPADYHGNAAPYVDKYAPPSYPVEPVPTYPDVMSTPQHPDTYRPRGNLHGQPAPSSVRSEGRQAPERPPPPQRSYTDVPLEKHSSQGHQGQGHSRHSEPRRLEFGQGNSGNSGPNGSGHYIDDHDTVI